MIFDIIFRTWKNYASLIQNVLVIWPKCIYKTGSVELNKNITLLKYIWKPLHLSGVNPAEVPNPWKDHLREGYDHAHNAFKSMHNPNGKNLRESFIV